MDYKVSYIQQWHPTDGTHYTQQVRISATEEELTRRSIHLAPGINYTDLDSFWYIVGRLGIHTDPRILTGRNSVILYEPDTNYFIDEKGNPYTDESWPAGGGLDKRCDYNGDALHCFYKLADFESIEHWMAARGFDLEKDDFPYKQTWEKGNTRIVFESYIDGLWGYVHTEFINE